MNNINRLNDWLTFISILLLCLLPEIYYFAAHDYDWRHISEGILLIIPLALLIKYIHVTTIQILLLVICLLISMTEVLSVYTYYNFTNAISIPALIYSNSSETGDMTYYIIHKALKHEVLPVLLFVTSCVLIVISRKRKAETIIKRSTIWGGITLFTGITVLSCNIAVFAHSPYHLLRETITALSDIKIKNDILTNKEEFHYDANRDSRCNNMINVLAIGESLNYSHCSFNGLYPRITTPQLQNISNIVYYTNYYSSATYTQQSLPLLLTRATPEIFSIAYKELPLTAAYSEVGYHTYIISNSSQIMNNGTDNYLTAGADSVIFVKNDRDIVSTMKDIVTNDEGNIFILLHFLGNHFFYSNYPSEYNRWQPNYTYNPEVKSDSLFINAYDNSILYTDSLLSACIDVLHGFTECSAFVFTADHGEYLDNHVGGHGLSCNPTKNEYHVPLMVWYSDEYKTAYPEKVVNMIRHKDEPVCADHIFWSVLDMANIRIDSTLQKNGMSIFGDTLFPHKRTLLLPDGKTVMKL